MLRGSPRLLHSRRIHSETVNGFMVVSGNGDYGALTSLELRSH